MAGAEGTTFGRYFLLKRIAAGGMGEIYLAKIKGPVGFEKLLVVKRILEQFVENEDFLDMFFAEARVAAQLTHSNIVQIYEMGQIDDGYFIAMEYCHGKGLRDVIDRARDLGDYVPPAHAVEIISKLCAGLSYAHNASDMSGSPLGIVHRDVNPHNTLVSYNGDVKVIDFGIAKSEMNEHETQAGTIKGKFVYMSPEQSAAEKLDKRSDIFAVGICLNEVLTGINPFAKANVVLTLDAIQRQEPELPSETNVRLAPFDPIIRKALAKKREERYQDCLELAEDLQKLLANGDVKKAPVPLPDYMQELFADQIINEKRMIVATDTATTEDLEDMRAAVVDSNTAATQVFDESKHGASSTGKTGKMSKPRRPTGSDRPLSEDDLFGDDDDEGVPDFDNDPTEHYDNARHRAAHRSSAARVEVVEEKPRSKMVFMGLLTGILLIAGAAAAVVLGVGGEQAEESPMNTVVTEVPAEGAQPPPAPAEPVPAPVETPPAAAPPQPPPTQVQPAPPPPVAAEHKSPRGKKKKKRDRPERDEESDGGGTGVASISASASPYLQASINGKPGQTAVLKADGGKITFGKAGAPNKLYVEIVYKIVKGKIVVNSIDAKPWAIVQKGVLSLGRTPVKNVQGSARRVAFEFVNPKLGKKYKISLRYSAP